MTELRTVRRALVSVYCKETSRKLVETLSHLGAEIVSTGGTLDYIHSLGIEAKAVESLTSFPSILGGRVKTLHPAIFGGILSRRNNPSDLNELSEFNIAEFDLVAVDLYPFEDSVETGASHDEIIEKIDIGGVSLIRAAAKNFFDVLVLPSAEFFDQWANFLEAGQGKTCLEERQRLAAAAFEVTSHYDTAIFDYLNKGYFNPFKKSIRKAISLRYGENPHQKGQFFGNLNEVFDQLSGKALSYNNLLDIDAALNLMAGFSEPTFAIIKHTNACGVASRPDLEAAWHEALSGDPVSAFGGILVANRNISLNIAYAINDLFFEVLIAPGYDHGSIEVLIQKKNRILLRQLKPFVTVSQFRSALQGVLWQTAEPVQAPNETWKAVTLIQPTQDQLADLRFANTIVKHLKSNAIALVKNKKLVGMGAGHTSRVDALKQAIQKANEFKHDLGGAVMASDAFFPFADSVERAYNAGINAVIQPGGSVKDHESIEFCNMSGMTMVFTGLRHFKH